MKDHTPPVKATTTSFRIIEALQANSGAGVSELSRDVDLSKSAVYKHVQTLVQLGYLVQVGNEYHLSLRFLNLGNHARERLPLSVARPEITALAETTGHTTNFIIREGNRGVYALHVDSDGGIEAGIREGDVVPLHATGGGKAVLAFLDDETRDEIIESTKLPQYTEKTITERSQLEEELRSIRDQRVAFDREEYITGRQSVASPIIGNDRPIGAISVAGPLKHMSGKRLEEDAAGLVTSTAKLIAKKLLSS